MSIYLSNVTDRIAAWVTSRLGREVLVDRKERATRLVEEAIELAQAEGVDIDVISRVANRVYERPVGDPRQEAAGVSVCLIAYCFAADLHPIAIAEAEILRVEHVPAEVTRAKHAEKVRAGTSMPRQNGEG